MAETKIKNKEKKKGRRRDVNFVGVSQGELKGPVEDPYVAFYS